jgi:hypothetical protein
MARCTKGWEDRCAHSKGTRCHCACGGENHGEEAKQIKMDFMARPRSKPKANYEIVGDEPGKPLVLRDLGPWDEYLTITNDAEGVVMALAAAGKLDRKPRLLYLDSYKELTELLYEESTFLGFKAVKETYAELAT